jgi:cobalamin biosynthesis protein CobT
MFFGVVQRMQLNHLETTALRLAIARDDPAIRKCLEVFRRTRNESDLMASLRTISRDTISSTLQEAGFEGVKSPSKQEVDAEADARRWINSRDDDDDGDDDAAVRGGADGEDDSGDGSSSEEEEGNNNRHDDEDEDDDDDDDESEDDEDDEGDASGGLSSQANRERVFPFLVSELSKDNIISAEDARTLYKLFLEKNDVLYSALDVYDLDNNIGELVDTMMNLAKLNR